MEAPTPPLALRVEMRPIGYRFLSRVATTAALAQEPLGVVVFSVSRGGRSGPREPPDSGKIAERASPKEPPP